MLNAIYEIGKNISGQDLSKDKFIRSLCLKLEEKNHQGQKQHVVLLNFNTKTGKIEIDIEEVNAGGKYSSKEYLWIGNQKGNNAKLYITSNSLENVISGVASLSFNEKIFNDLHITSFFKKLNKKEKNKDKSIHFLTPSVFAFTEKDISSLESLQNDIENESEFKKTKKLISKLYGELLNVIAKKLRINKSQIILFTVLIDGKPISQKEEYINIIFYDKIHSLFDTSGDYKKNLRINGICHVCKRSDLPTTSNFTNLSFKYYMTDKLGFSSNLDDTFLKNFNICEECYQYNLIAERFISENLKTRIGGFNTYILPSFVYPKYDFNFNNFSKYLTYKIETISNLGKLETELKDYLFYEDNKNSYIINFLFFYNPAGKSEFKILKLIKDVPPTRISTIKDIEENIYRRIIDDYDENRTFTIDLNALWGCIPIKMDKRNRKMTGVSKYLDLIDNIFSDKPINYQFLINQVMDTIKIIKYENENYNIWQKQDFTNKIIQLNFLLLFFKKLNLIGEQKMEKKNNPDPLELIPEEIQYFWKDIEVYTDERKALFLMGFLMGEIASKQKAKEMKNKPILDKINFQGMGKEKIMRFSSEIFEKLRQNKILDFNEDIFSAAKILLDDNINNWTLSNQENVFYILSGYAYSNYLIRKRSRDKYFSELEEKMKLLEKLKSEGKETTEVEEAINQSKEEAEKKHYYEARKILK